MLITVICVISQIICYIGIQFLIVAIFAFMFFDIGILPWCICMLFTFYYVLVRNDEIKMFNQSICYIYINIDYPTTENY